MDYIFPPRTHVILSQQAHPISWPLILAELCDNSFDAYSSCIRIKRVAQKRLVVTDDGRGCDDIESMLSLGGHNPHDTDGSGFYGVGFKDVCFNIAPEISIDTTRDHIRRTVRVNWNDVRNSDEWASRGQPDPENVPSRANGTRLEFSPLTKMWRNESKIFETLGYIFAPALSSGKQIWLESNRKSPVAIKPWTMPKLIDPIELDLVVGGRQVHLRAGVLHESESSKWAGFSYAYAHRMCFTEPQSFGVPPNTEYSVSRMCAYVVLGPQWKEYRTKNKQDLLDSAKEELGEAMWIACKDLIETSTRQAETMVNDRLASDVTDMLQAAIKPNNEEPDLGKARRRRPKVPEKPGTVEPAGTGGKHKRARRIQPGGRLMRRFVQHGIRMEWRDGMNGVIGRVDRDGCRVFLNANSAFLQPLRKKNNRDAIWMLCMFLIADADRTMDSGGQYFLQQRYDSLIEALSDILVPLDEEDGTS